MITPRADMLFEISWEVCNKVGGIYTVLHSKLSLMQQLYSNYVLIGPDLHTREFDERPVPQEWEEIFTVLAEQGIHCRYGVWLAPGEPTVILVQSSLDQREGYKSWLWERFQVDSLHASFEFDEPMCFAMAAGKLIELYAARHKKKIVTHCHEWMTGFALLQLKDTPNVATVFTTHATMIGRTIAGNGYELYDMLDTINPDEWVYKFNVQDKHTAEKACAHNADVFTTVSKITGMEAERLLGKKPDVLVYNGFNTEKFPTYEETTIQHNRSKELLKEFLAYTFYPYYSIDLDNTLLFFTSGRYEFRNKGLDVLIEALGQLNRELQGKKIPTIVVFFCVIMGKEGIKANVMENKNYYQHVQSTVKWHGKHLLQHVTLDILSGQRSACLARDALKDIHENVNHFTRAGDTPPVSTHEIPNASQDPILHNLREQGLQNAEQDPIKVVLYPGYLNAADGLLNLNYYDATIGMNLGIFPSAYEPWGYTPMESAVLGVPTVTTNLAGFGRFMESCDKTDCEGIVVIPREGKKHDEMVQKLKETLREFIVADRVTRVQHGFMAKTHSIRCDWKVFIKHYVEAHNLALERL